MGRLEDIVERNKNPRKHGRGRFPFGIAFAIFFLIILVLMVFTDLDETPDERKATSGDPSHEHRVDGIYLGTPRATPKPAPAPKAAR